MIYKTLKKVSNYCQLLDKSKYPATKTVNGVTFTNNGDGTITVNGTATENAFISLDGIGVIKGHKYLWKGTPVGGASSTFHSYIFGRMELFVIDTGSGIILTMKENGFTYPVLARVMSSTTVSNLVFKPQLFDLTEMYGAGNEPTTVEQFRQDFPEELYDYKPYCFVKSYKNTMICKTKNLFPTSTAVGTLSAWEQSTTRQFEEDKWYMGISGNNYYAPNNIIDYELTENYVYINGTGSGYGIGKAFKCEPNQTYTVSCKWIKNTTYFEIATGFYDENGKFLHNISSGYLVERKTFTTPANCKWFTVCFIAINKGSTYVYNIQLEEGSTSTDFVPNGYIQSYKKSLVCKTKNLFDYTKVNGLEHTSTGNPYSNYLKINGESFGVMVGLYDRGVNFIPHFILNAGTYTMSLTAKGTYPGEEGQFGIIKFNSDGTKPSFTKQWVTSDSRQSYTFTLDENSEIAIRVQAYGNASNAKNLDSTFSNIQLELGDTATDYVPYGHL